MSPSALRYRPRKKAPECGASPTFNFGRMPAGYAMSTGNNAKLVAAGKRFRGGPTNEVLPSHAASIAPIGKLEKSVVASDWCGHQWSEWQPLSDEDAASRRSRAEACWTFTVKRGERTRRRVGKLVCE